MNNDYVAEILRATGTLQSGDPAGVTAIIQNALAAAGLTGSVDAGPSGNPNPGLQPPQAFRPGAERLPPRTDRLRKPLSEVINTLRSGGMGLGLEGLPGLGQPAHIPELPLPDGAQFLDQRYSCAAGARRYRLYVPSTADAGGPTVTCGPQVPISSGIEGTHGGGSEHRSDGNRGAKYVTKTADPPVSRRERVAEQSTPQPHEQRQPDADIALEPVRQRETCVREQGAEGRLRVLT